MTPLKILVIADSLAKANHQSDTGVAFAREAIGRSHQVYWCESNQINLLTGDLITQCLEIVDENLNTSGLFLKPLNEFDQVWIRKDPPFDIEYISLCWNLATYENEIQFINPPSLLIAHHEKFIPLQALRSGHLNETDIIPTWKPTPGLRFPPNDFPKGVTISKPWMGHGGRDIEKWDSIQSALDSFSDEQLSQTIFQPFMPEISHGDRRVFFLSGEVVGDLLRVPKTGEFISNLAQGGSGILKKMSETEENVCEKLGNFLKEKGILIAGADLIGPRVSEVNVTAPTGVQQIKSLGGPDISKLYLEMAENL